jgi:TPR repeat protein
LWQLRDNEVKYIYIILLFLFVSVPALAQDFSLSKDKKQENAIEDYVIRPPQKLNYTAICQQNNQLNQAQVKYFLQQELEGRFNAEKYYYLARIYYYGIGSAAKDKAKALAYAKNAADAPSSWRKVANFLLAKMQFKALQEGDEASSRELQNTISMMMQDNIYNANYYAGKLGELKGDYSTAYSHYRLSAPKNEQASLALAHLYFSGKAPNSSSKKTIEMLKQAQAQTLERLNGGDCAALITMADMFLQGKVMKPKILVGLEWLQVALQSGYGMAGVRLGEYYMQGKGVEKDEAMARNFWQQASNIGSKRAMFLLGEDALKRKKIKTAIKWLKQAANLNYAPAKHKLKQIYADNDKLI